MTVNESQGSLVIDGERPEWSGPPPRRQLDLLDSIVRSEDVDPMSASQYAELNTAALKMLAVAAMDSVRN